MFPEERQQRITEALEREGRVGVGELARRFGVTEDCVRKDLRALVAQGRCRRVYGGATRLEPQVNRNVADRVGDRAAQKRSVAEKAVALVGDGVETVFVDVSSTGIVCAQLLVERRPDAAFTLVTNSVDVARAAARGPHVHVVCPGGAFSPEYDGFVGAAAAEALGRLRFDLALMGTVGVDPKSGEVLCLDLDDAAVKRCVLARSGRRALLCDAEKLGHGGSVRYASLDDFDLLLCDDTGAADVAAVRRAGVRVP